MEIDIFKIILSVIMLIVSSLIGVIWKLMQQKMKDISDKLDGVEKGLQEKYMTKEMFSQHEKFFNEKIDYTKEKTTVIDAKIQTYLDMTQQQDRDLIYIKSMLENLFDRGKK